MMGLRKRIISICVIGILGANLYFMVLAKEIWPFTSAPMFGPAVSRDQALYRFEFRATCADGSTKVMRPKALGLHWAFGRYFFKYVYGAAERLGDNQSALSLNGVWKRSPFVVFERDNKQAFERRLKEFFAPLAELSKRTEVCRALAINRINLSLVQLPSPSSIETYKLIASYNVESDAVELNRPFPLNDGVES